jgi:hypothetical protein
MGPGARIAAAFRCFFVLLFKGRIPADLLGRFRPLPGPEAAAPAAPPVAKDQPADRAIQLLALMQRDGRLVDFLQEDITAYADAQVGAAVREVHANCRAVLHRYVTVEPVLSETEGDRVRLTDRADPVRVKLLGAVPSSKAAMGTVRHRGWRATQIDLPPLAPQGRDVIAPAEIEVA